ncbi:MAG: PilZ domain-containing protein [Thermodesulfobacteriota bacterium]
MFSKKTDEPLVVSIDPDRRNFFRVEPSSKNPLWIRIGQGQYSVKDIGAGGVGIYRKTAQGELEVGKRYPFHVALPLVNENIMGNLKVRHISEKAYHCEFIDIGEENQEKLHLFVLERQKEQLTETKDSD